MPITWEKFPPSADDEARRDWYARAESLYRGAHADVFGFKPGRYQMARYVVANFASAIANLSADFLFGEPPGIVDPDGGEAQNQWLEEMREANDLLTLLYEGALACSFRGDTILKARWGRRNPVDVDAPEEAIIEETPASYYFPERDEDNVRLVRKARLAWIKRDATDKDARYLRVEEHEPGTIRNELYKLDASGAVGDPVDLAKLYEDPPEEEIETKIPMIPIFHVPNIRFGSRFWGLSDYDFGLMSIFEALNERVSQIDEVLRKHVAPKLVLPPGMIDREGKVRFDQMETITLTGRDQPPSYITWDAHLTAAFKQVENLIELLFVMSETAPSVFGLDKFGIAESGRALKLRLLRTLAKIGRKQNYWRTGIVSALRAAMALQKAWGQLPFEPFVPTIEWADGLPADIVEQVEIEEMRLRSGNTSIESSVERLDGTEQAEEEMRRIGAEQEQATVMTGAAGRRGEPAREREQASEEGEE